MPDVKAVLTEEIRRLAKKEIKAAIEPLQKTLADQKKLISELKKRVAVLENKKAVVSAVSEDKQDDAPEEPKLRLNAAGIVRVRSKLKLTQAEFARLLGVAAHTVSIWELGKVSPRRDAKAAICALRGLGKRELKKRLADLAAAEEK